MTRRSPDALNQREYDFCIAYVGAAAGNGTQAARLAGYKGSDKVLGITAVRILGIDRVKDYIKALNQQNEKRGLMLKANRLARLQKRWEQVDAELTARGANTAPGFGTAGSGIMAIEIDDLHRVKIRADTALLKEEREIAKQAAIELGEWTEKVEQSVNVSGDVPIIEIVVELETAGRQRAETEEADLDALDWDGETAEDADPAGYTLDDWDDEADSEDPL